ncbi:type II secretion system minor pseudopilin GspH [Povalibacter sp.]|uniref:type II secretion system minor pseudopilin GspH n=1 Tax=Povalibacter sp. TaxID=1962978 RepID=UPI002F3FC99B
MHLPTRRHFRRGVTGFTLLEILVVMIIIGVIVSAATLSMGVLGRDRESEDQMQRIWAVLKQAREETELQGLDLGMFVWATGYEFLRYDGREKRWLPIEDDRLFAPRALPEGLRFRMWVESREIVLKPGPVDRSDKVQDAKWLPQVFILSSGDIMPFDLALERDSQPAIWRVLSQPDTDLRLERRTGTEPWSLVAQTKPPTDKEKDARNAKQTKR